MIAHTENQANKIRREEKNVTWLIQRQRMMENQWEIWVYSSSVYSGVLSFQWETKQNYEEERLLIIVQEPDDIAWQTRDTCFDYLNQ